jgi:muramidase (phage lysozyme)
LNFTWFDYDSPYYYLVRLFDPVTQKTIRYRRLRRAKYTGRALMVRVDEPKGDRK